MIVHVHIQIRACIMRPEGIVCAMVFISKQSVPDEEMCPHDWGGRGEKERDREGRRA